MKKSLLLLLFLSFGILMAQKPISTSATTKHATVYSAAAELTQTATVTVPSGTSEIVIRNIADYVNENTVQIGAPSTLTILSVQFVKNYKEETEEEKPNPLHKKWNDSIAFYRNEINKISIEKTANQETIKLLDKKEVAGTTKPEITVSEFIKLVDYYKVKRNELGQAINTLNQKEAKIQEKISAINEKLQTKKVEPSKFSQGSLVLQVMSSAAGTANLEINYLTNGASWQPFYDLRAENINNPINLMYKAKVTQNTGIDWKKVKLTLSSGNPNQSNVFPLLQQWLLRFGNPLAYELYDNSNAMMNTISSGISQELKKEKAGRATVSNNTTITENQLNISFDIDIPYDILSNGKAHSVAMKEIKIPVDYRYYAAPRIEKDAFLLAEISDYSKFNLLPGEANIIFEGMYVGKTFINPNQTADTLRLTMGRDRKINITREKVADKSGTKFLSSFKEQTFTYEITVKNNKKEAVELILKDQYPISTNDEITVDLLKSDNAKINKETGILTWDLKLAPNETKKIRISYKIKYPKDKVIDNL
jgi:uncharacterized protein (TIGR02231 family)